MTCCVSRGYAASPGSDFGGGLAAADPCPCSTLPLAHDQFDPGRGALGVLVFPDPDNPEAGSRKCFVCFSVTPPVGRELAPPETGVGFGRDAVLWTPVPEASIYEDGHARSREDHVDLTAREARDRDMESEAETAAVQC